MSRCFVVQTIPKSLMNYYEVSQAAYNFCSGLSSLEVFEEVVSLVPINVTVDVNSHKSNNDKIKYFQIPISLFKNKIFSTLGLIFINYRLAIYLKNKSSIWYYNISPSNFLSILFLYLLFGKKVYLILADYTPTKRHLSIQYLLGHMIKITVGIIALSGRTNFKHTNIKIIAGYTHGKYSPRKIDKTNITSFLIGGRLDKSTGIDIAIEVFKLLPQFNLVISGNMDDFWKNKIKGYENIRYLGNLGYKEYLKIFEETPVVLSLRNPEFEKNNNNFPSKILEAFEYGKIVISTMEYDEIKSLNYFYSNYDVKSLKLIVEKVVNLNESDLQKCFHNTGMLEENFGYKHWNESIKEIENS